MLIILIKVIYCNINRSQIMYVLLFEEGSLKKHAIKMCDLSQQLLYNNYCLKLSIVNREVKNVLKNEICFHTSFF